MALFCMVVFLNMEILSILFGTSARVKLMRLFLFNTESTFDAGDISSRAQISPAELRKEIAILLKSGLIFKKSYIKEVKVVVKPKVKAKRNGKKGTKSTLNGKSGGFAVYKAGKSNASRLVGTNLSAPLSSGQNGNFTIGSQNEEKIVIKKVKTVGWYLNEKFPYLLAIKNLLTVASLDIDTELIKKIGVAGKIKLLLVAGVFIQDWESRVDILAVGESMSSAKFDNIIKGIEAELGRDISYTMLDSAEFDYRLHIHDKLIRDILDCPHRVLIDKIGLKTDNSRNS